MEENKSCTDGQCRRTNCLCAAAPFVAGVLVALAFGWWVFPDMMYSEQHQPILFKHSAHITRENQSCSKCHTFRADGSFTGAPNIETCAACHATMKPAKLPAGASAQQKAEFKALKLLEEHLASGKPFEWQIHQAQPDNVFFSHAAHMEKCYKCHLTMKGALDLGTPQQPEKLCMQCHPSIAELDKVPPVKVNILTDYTQKTMKMWACEHCHAHPAHYNDGMSNRTVANNACLTCHK